MPSARTPVGNEEDEYEKANKKVAVQPQTTADTLEAIGGDAVVVAVALRHDTDPKASN